MSAPGLVVVLTGPSGVGKSSVIRALLAREPRLTFSVSHTTRPPRGDERDGVDYHFVSVAAFERLREAGGFVESAEVHGHLYGTSWAEIESATRSAKEILLDIDVQGAAQVAVRLPEAVSIFLLPPSYGALEERLRGRGSEDEASIARRLRNASEEVRLSPRFRHVVVNESVDESTDQVRTILAAERLRTSRRREDIERVLATFPDPPGPQSPPAGPGGGGTPGGPRR